MLLEKDNLITENDCDEIIKMAESQFRQATTLGVNNGHRIADYTWIYRNTPIANKFLKIANIETGLPIENMEDLHIVRYNVGGQYKDHHDFFHPGESYYDREVLRGGQRVKSVIFYLNDDFEGGETDFPKMGITVKPVKCKTIIWDNINEDGTLDYDSIHAGLPVTNGVKYIATIWIRENVFK
jgi:prolyl 4-hydroxylase